MQSNNLLTVTALALASAALAPVAHAHINMVGALQARGGDQKNFPCDGARGDGPVYEIAPGSSIVLEVDEYVPHPGYFRVAFDDDGDDAFAEPKSIKPVDPMRKCPYDQYDQCGESDFCSMVSTKGEATVLYDNIYPHLANKAKKQKWVVKLPNVECDNCVLQVIQVMEDTVHGAYCPSDNATCNRETFYIEDLYHRCIDIKLVKGAKSIPGVTTDPVSVEKGIDCIAKAGGSTEEPGTPPDETDAGKPVDEGRPDASSEPSSPRDAGADEPENEDTGDAGDADEVSSGTIKRDASTVTKDAGKGGSSGSKKDSGSDEPTSSGGGDSGCAVATNSSRGAAWALLGVGLLFVRRRRVAKAS